ncbi:MAG: DUF6282 family protein [Anaerolineae bacterium]|nr:DUF6282 family protein [Anaerolineae bacterium]NUQ04087.1 hypothetical protein [Anaerolineae bacterium]
MMDRVSVVGAFDLHVHSAPCVYPRLADDLTIAEAARDAGLRGMVFKSHHEATVGRAAAVNAALTRQNPTPFNTYGSVTLNHALGGINPAAVETALKTGARVVWLPTVDSQGHVDAFGYSGSWDVQGAEFHAQRSAPLTILAQGALTPQVKAILSLCQEQGVALATGHLGKAEVVALAQFARRQRFERLVITHPLFRVPGFQPEELPELVAPGVFFEFTYCALSPMWRHTTVEDTVAAIQTVGVEQAYLSSDGGQTHNPIPHEGLRLLAQMCLEKGLSLGNIRMLIEDTPARLIGAQPN